MNGHLLSKNQSEMRGQQDWVALFHLKDILWAQQGAVGEVYDSLHYFSRLENMESFHKGFLFLLHII